MDWLDAVSGTVAGIAVTLLVVVNAIFAIGVLVTRDRRFVDRWTKALVGTDAALVVAAIAVPVVRIGITLATKGLVALGALSATPIHGK